MNRTTGAAQRCMVPPGTSRRNIVAKKYSAHHKPALSGQPNIFWPRERRKLTGRFSPGLPYPSKIIRLSGLSKLYKGPSLGRKDLPASFRALNFRFGPFQLMEDQGLKASEKKTTRNTVRIS
uniref:Uncharacterized protein n=1 Tax=Romanomermis culicivorax TaxID=13658 RepID=A0A915IR24_ROMCU